MQSTQKFIIKTFFIIFFFTVLETRCVFIFQPISFQTNQKFKWSEATCGLWLPYLDTTALNQKYTPFIFSKAS